MPIRHFRKIIACVVAVAFVLLAAEMSTRTGDYYTVTAEFAKTPGLYVGNDVEVLGVNIGTITRMEAHGDAVSVEMRLDRAVKIPEGATAVLLPNSVVTDRVIELTPTYRTGPALGEGDVIPVARTRTPVEFQDVVASVNSLSHDLGKMEKGSGAIDTFMRVAAANAEGNGTRLRETLQGLQSALGGFASDPSDTIHLVRQLARLVGVMASNDSTIRSFSRSLTQATTIVASDGKGINRAFGALLNALRDVAGFVHTHRTALRAGLSGFGSAAHIFGRRSRDLGTIVDLIPLMMQNIQRAVDTKDNVFRGRLSVLNSAQNLDIVAGLCKLYTGMPICGSLHPGLLGPDLGLTELLTGSTP